MKGLGLLDVDGKERRIRLSDTGAPLRIGRAAGNDLVLPSPFVSSHHASIERRGERSVVVDRRSCNGTFVNGQPVTESVLAAGDLVEFGDRRFKVVQSAWRAWTTRPRSMRHLLLATVAMLATVGGLAFLADGSSFRPEVADARPEQDDTSEHAPDSARSMVAVPMVAATVARATALGVAPEALLLDEALLNRRGNRLRDAAALADAAAVLAPANPTVTATAREIRQQLVGETDRAYREAVRGGRVDRTGQRWRYFLFLADPADSRYPEAEAALRLLEHERRR